MAKQPVEVVKPMISGCQLKAFLVLIGRVCVEANLEATETEPADVGWKFFAVEMEAVMGNGVVKAKEWEVAKAT